MDIPIQAFVDLVVGPAGALGLALIILYLFIRGVLVAKPQVDKLQETNEAQAEALKAQAQAWEKVKATQEESVELARTTVRLLTSAREATGIHGEARHE